jgi:PAS domain S-box-containing protein
MKNEIEVQALTHIDALQEMLFMTSHKVRKPIATVLGLMQLLNPKSKTKVSRTSSLNYSLKNKKMNLSIPYQVQDIMTKKIQGVFSFKENYIKAPSLWTDNQAELLSHIKIIDQSALLSISDLKGNIIHANDLFCSVSKYSYDEILNKPHSMIRHPDTPASIFKDMWSTIAKGNVWQGELKNLAKDGSEYWVIATVAPVMGANGKPIKYISIRYDITKQKQTEKELFEAKKKIDTELNENIAYAKHIHGSFLTNMEDVDSRDDSFLIYKAQKTISGDFHKIKRARNKITVTIGDSTGHGVSASYISVLVLNILTRVLPFCSGNPVKIMKLINKELNRITHLNKEKPLIETADMIVCCINKETMKLNYASARMRAFIIRGDEVILLEKDRCTIGESIDSEFKITNRSINLQKEDHLYILSDGLSDQIGGPKDKRFIFKNVLSVIKKSQMYSMKLQKQIIEDALKIWQGNNEQTDDITVFGIKI